MVKMTLVRVWLRLRLTTGVWAERMAYSLDLIEIM